MSAGTMCWECRRLVPEEELEVGRDGRPMCCCCRQREQDAKLAEKERGDRVSDAADETVKLRTEASIGARELPPPEPDQSGWAGMY